MLPLAGSIGTRENQASSTNVPDFSRSLLYNGEEYYLDFWELKRIPGYITDWWSEDARDSALDALFNSMAQMHDTAARMLVKKRGIQKRMTSLLICGIWFTALEWDISRVIEPANFRIPGVDQLPTNSAASLLDPNSDRSMTNRLRPPITPVPQTQSDGGTGPTVRASTTPRTVLPGPPTPDTPEESELPSYSDDKYYADLVDKISSQISKRKHLKPLIRQYNECAFARSADGTYKLTDEFLHAIFEPFQALGTRFGVNLEATQQASWFHGESNVQPSEPREEVKLSPLSHRSVAHNSPELNCPPGCQIV